MKKLTNFITETKHLADPEMPHEDGKTPERIAYDYNDFGWVVEAYCYADGSSPVGCNSLKELLRRYDFSGAMQEALDCPDDYEIDDNTIIVGAYMVDDESEVAAWVWGYDGICYENAPKNAPKYVTESRGVDVSSSEVQFCKDFKKKLNELDSTYKDEEDSIPISSDAYKYIVNVLGELTDDFENLTLGATFINVLEEHLKW